VAVVGAGAAGIYTALVAARAGARVVLVSRSPLAESASYWAQGGIAAALAVYDSPERHLADTLAAGRGASRPSAARVLCEESPASVRDLESLGVHWDADRHGELALGLEGGHSVRRVVHAGGSATGRRITRDLSALAVVDDRIEVLERTTAGALWRAGERCAGLLAARLDGGHVTVRTRATVLATGGAAALWHRTTNPRGAIGAGLTLADRSGARLADLEFVQFHPTALVHDDPQHDGFLITEAIRGEGAHLIDDAGERFVDELAPRDQVALAVQGVLRSAPDARVYLDMRAIDMSGFPNVAAALRRAGLDPAREPVPVAPAAHYTMGGIAVDLDGRSSIDGLFAVGECACNGLHGANRLASNSLAECFVFGRRAAEAAAAAPPLPTELPPPPDEVVDPGAPRESREALSAAAGLQRNAGDLRRLLDDPFPLARRIAALALARSESRGAHQRSDFPSPDATLDGVHFTVGGDDDPVTERWE
jgi:L-aspartate oxidase